MSILLDPELVERPENKLDVERINNVIFVVAGKLGLEAIEANILILLDPYKSGYECKACNGTGTYIKCECDIAQRYGTKENGKKCPFKEVCDTQIVGTQCKNCKGKGTTVIVPDQAKALPTSGVIVSCGPKVTTRKIGERVLFGVHTGYFIPFKGNAKLRSMREDEPMCKLLAVDNSVALGDFLQIDDTPEDR